MTGPVIGSRYINCLNDVEGIGLVSLTFVLREGACTRKRECWLVYAAHPQYTIPVLNFVTKCSVYVWMTSLVLVRHL